MMQFFGTLEKEEELHAEFKLFLSKEKIIMLCTIKGIKERKKQNNFTLNFHSISEKPDEQAVELIRQTFSGKKINKETRDMLLYGQLQDGLLYIAIKSSTVSGAQYCKVLCTAAEREENNTSKAKKL